MAGDSSIGLRSPRPLVSLGVTRRPSRARTVARTVESASCKAGPRRACSQSEAPMTLPVFVGIDVAKASLDVAVRPSGERWQLANEEAALLPLLTRLQSLGRRSWSWRRREALNTRWRLRSPRRACRWRSSIRAKCVTSLGRWAAGQDRSDRCPGARPLRGPRAARAPAAAR